jgi:chromosome segregation ATPase
VNLRTREGSNYTPLSIAIELNNKAIESWLLKNAEAIPDDSSVEYEVAAFKAFDQFDSAVNSIKYLPYPGDKSYAGVYQKHEVWLGKFPEQINSTQSTLTFLKPGKHKTEIKSRLYTQVNPLLQYCESIIRQSQKEDRQSQDAQNQINRYEIHGISSIEQVDRQVDHYGSTINKVKKYIQETQSKLSTTRDQYAKLQQEMAKKKRLHDQTQKRRYSFNQFTQTEEWKAAFNQESKISKSMILLKSSISKVKYELESSDKSVKEMNAEIEKIQSKIGELQATREKISNEEPDSSSVMTRLGQNLENACAVAKNFINSI